MTTPSSSLTTRDMTIGRLIYELYRLMTGGCEGIQLTPNQLLCFAQYLPYLKEALPHLPSFAALSLILSNLDKLLPPKNAYGELGYTLWLCWDRKRHLRLLIADIDLINVHQKAREPLEAFGSQAGAQVWHSDDTITYAWDPR